MSIRKINLAQVLYITPVIEGLSKGVAYQYKNTIDWYWGDSFVLSNTSSMSPLKTYSLEDLKELYPNLKLEIREAMFPCQDRQDIVYEGNIVMGTHKPYLEYTLVSGTKYKVHFNSTEELMDAYANYDGLEVTD